MEFIYEAVNPWWQGHDFDAGIGRELYLGELPDYETALDMIRY
jgi:hypothetical protein